MVYERWGATEKVALLREKCTTLAPYDSLRYDEKPRRKVTSAPPMLSDSIAHVVLQKTSTVSSIDLDVIVQASQTISNEVCSGPTSPISHMHR